MKPIHVINKLNESSTFETIYGDVIKTTSPVDQEYGINKNADYISGLNVGDTVGLRWIKSHNSNKLAKIKDITKDYIELDIWDEQIESLLKKQRFSTKNIEICSREIRFSSLECVEGKEYTTLMFVEIEKQMNESSETESKWVYVSKHGLGPGTVPKDIEISNVYDEPNSMNTVFCSNRKLTQEELNKYELKPFIGDKEIKEDNFSVDNKVDSIDMYGDYFQYEDILEEQLGYEFMLKLYDDMTGNNNLIIYKEKSGNEDFIVMDRTDSGGTMYKVDHNGERLFFSENEAKALVKEDE